MLPNWRWLLSLAFLLVILTQESGALPPPGYAQRLDASISLRDYLNAGVSNVGFTLQGQIGWTDSYGQPQLAVKFAWGNTDGSGNLYVYVDFTLGEDYNYPVQYTWTSVQLTNGVPSGYSVFEKTDMYGYGTSRNPSVLVVPTSAEQNGNGVPDPWESVVAYTFSPVLHKQSWDKQAGLQNVNTILDSYSTVTGWNYLGQQIYQGDIPPSHAWQDWHGDSYGVGSQQGPWKIDFDDAQRYTSAAVGNRPIYFHLYKANVEDRYYYLHYWYFFTMNDVSEQTQYHTYHEGDLEHVSIKLQRSTASSLVPIDVNFYQHTGGHTQSAAQCWWSTNSSLSYSGIQQGYDANRAHLHIWLAANSHASYNRFEKVYDLTITVGGIEFDHYVDNVDYNPTSYDLYFPYDFLVNMGEVFAFNNATRHGYTYSVHNDHYGDSSLDWLSFVGNFGAQWWTHETVGISGATTPSPKSPFKDAEWRQFTTNYSEVGFGNESGGGKTYRWVDDSASGD